MSEQAILHEASEIGQSRKEEPIELLIVACRTALRALGTSLLWGSIVTVGRWLFGDSMTWWSVLVTYGAIGALRFGVSIEDDLDLHQEGLRAEKSAKSYAPSMPEPQPQPSPWRSPVPVTAGNHRGVLDMNDPVPQLPDGRNAQLAPSPESMAVILSEVLDRHGGKWSRKRLMSIRVDGKRITRKLYEQLTADLAKVGFLRERPTGGFELPTDVRGYTDLVRYFPSLPRLEGGNPARTAGGLAGRQERGGIPDAQADDGEVTHAERRRQRWMECNCDVKLYLRGKS